MPSPRVSLLISHHSLENVTQAKSVSMFEDTFLPMLGTTVRTSAPFNSCYGYE